MKIAIRGGHNPKSIGSKALIDELTEDRKTTAATIKYLKSLGHQVLDVTPGPMDTNADLLYGVRKANEWGADLFISEHFNKCYDKYNGAIGTEVWTYNIAFDEAKRVVDGLVSLGFKNRGVKFSKGLYELKHTNMKAMIIEVCFVEATKDVELYKRLGPDAIGKKIAESIANKKVSSSNSNSSSTTKPPANTSLKVGDVVNITGSKYATGENVSDWSKKQKHTIKQIKGDRALLKEINSWCYLKDLKIATNNKKLGVGMYVQMIGTKWATGQSVPSWIKDNKYKVKEIKSDKALLDSVMSWAYIKDLKY